MGTNSGEWEQMPLTDTKLRTLRPREKPYSQSDGGGLLIEVMPGGKRVWRLRYRLAGRQEKVTLGEYPTFLLAQARQWLADCRVMIERGESPMKAKREEKAAKKDSDVVAVFAEEWMREVVDKTNKSPRNILRVLNKDVIPAIGNK